MRRWGQITEAKPAMWYAQMAEKVFKPAVYLEAAQLLIDEGFLTGEEVPFGTDGYKRPIPTSSMASSTTARSRSSTSMPIRSATRTDRDRIGNLVFPASGTQ